MIVVIVSPVIGAKLGLSFEEGILNSRLEGHPSGFNNLRSYMRDTQDELIGRGVTLQGFKDHDPAGYMVIELKDTTQIAATLDWLRVMHEL